MPPSHDDILERPPVQSGGETPHPPGSPEDDYGSKRLGQILIDEGEITAKQLVEALEIQKSKGGFIGQILVDLKYVNQETVVASLVKQCKIPHLSLLDYEISKDILQLLPQEVCLKHHLLPIDRLGRILTVAMVNPLNEAALEHVRKLCPDLRIKPILCDWQHFRIVAGRLFGVAGPEKESPFEAASFGSSGKGKTAAPAAPRPAAPETPAAKVQAPPAEASPGITPETLAALVQDAMVSALQESDSAGHTGAAANKTPAATGPERHRPPKMAPPGAFSQTRRRVQQGVDYPEWLVESDERVLASLHCGQLSPEFQFGDFVGGAVNAFTLKLCEAVAARPGTDYNPFFLYGEVGVGKTHLINAVGNTIAGNSEARVGYTSADRFADRVTAAFHQHAADAFRESYCHYETLIMDDVQSLGGRTEAQEEFFHILDVYLRESRQIIIAGDRPPDLLNAFEPRLVSRFASGIVAAIKAPEYEARLEILRRLLAAKDVTLPEELISLIAMRVSVDIRKMIGALRKVIAYAELVGEKITCEKAEEILAHLRIENVA